MALREMLASALVDGRTAAVIVHQNYFARPLVFDFYIGCATPRNVAVQLGLRTGLFRATLPVPRISILLTSSVRLVSRIVWACFRSRLVSAFEFLP